MSCVDGTEFRQYFVVTNLSDGKIRGRYRFTKEDVARLGWDVPQVDRGVRTEAKMEWLREHGLQDFTHLREYPLWGVNWGRQPAVIPWEQWTYWQYTAEGSIPWIKGDVDLNLRVRKERP